MSMQNTRKHRISTEPNSNAEVEGMAKSPKQCQELRHHKRDGTHDELRILREMIENKFHDPKFSVKLGHGV
jgi:hypothetical protein